MRDVFGTDAAQLKVHLRASWCKLKSSTLPLSGWMWFTRLRATKGVCKERDHSGDGLVSFMFNIYNKYIFGLQYKIHVHVHINLREK